MSATPETRSPMEKTRSRNEFLGRLSVYLIGVAIGFLLLGFFKAKSRAEAQRREAERAAAMPRGATASPAETSGGSTGPGTEKPGAAESAR
ncbi:MAG TPA: hypothetical protein VF777_07125 [Phycisphaerales bacterium]